MTCEVVDMVYFGKSEITKELRGMLDEQGVNWDYGITGASSTKFNVNGIDLTFTPMRDGLVCSTILTPEQVIKIVSGTGTCRMRPVNHYRESEISQSWGCTCSSCGGFYAFTRGKEWDFCPRCRKRIVWDISE